MGKLFLALFVLLHIASVQAFELITEQVTEDIYVLVGEIGPRSYENNALNNTMGFVITEQGVILVGSGASPSGARLIDKAIAKVTQQPVRWVVNIGAQDHHWLGNSYFSEKGAEIIALARTVNSQQFHVDDHLQRLRQVTKEQASEVKAVYASNPVKSNTKKLSLGGIEAELIWSGGGHFSDDAMLWLPQQKVVFTGDLVFHDRLPGVQPFTPVVKWKAAFDAMAALKPDFVVPGHGHTGNLEQAKRDTGNYLGFLITQVRAAQEDWKEMGETVDALADAKEFKHLQFYEGWHRRNINRTFLQLESAQ